MSEPTPAALTFGSHIIRIEEGFRADPYWDASAHCYSVGNGMCEYADGTAVSQHTRSLSPAEAEAQIQDKLAREYVSPVMRLLAGITLTDGQTAALLSFTWNGGPGALTNFGVPTCLRRSDVRGAIAGMRRLNTSRGIVVPDLVARRQREGLVFAGGPYHPRPASPTTAEIEAALVGRVAAVTAASPVQPVKQSVGLGQKSKMLAERTADELNADELDRMRG